MSTPTWNVLRSNPWSSAQSEGTGNASRSTFCGTHFLSLTAHAVKASTALSWYRSPQRICTHYRRPLRQPPSNAGPWQRLSGHMNCLVSGQEGDCSCRGAAHVHVCKRAGG